jgi:uncharacterized glyoxalase superfamily protein PhnB
MIHVPNVQATVDWYKTVGFTVNNTYDDGCGGISFAVLSFGSTQVMFNQGGHPSPHHRRDVDLYVHTSGVDDRFAKLNDGVEIIEGPHDTFYGMREFLIRDLNGFWLTFGEESAYGQLMNAMNRGDIEGIKTVLDRGAIKSEWLTNALMSVPHENAEIAELLRQAGATLPPTFDNDTLLAYAGHYENESRDRMQIVVEDGQLFAKLGPEGSISLVAIDQVTFRPTYLERQRVTFKLDDAKVTGFDFDEAEGEGIVTYTRVEE